MKLQPTIANTFISLIHIMLRFIVCFLRHLFSKVIVDKDTIVSIDEVENDFPRYETSHLFECRFYEFGSFGFREILKG